MRDAGATDPLVSIVTPSYNQAHYIETTLRSVASQTYPNIEHIVVDGGSTDGSVDILRRHERLYDMKWISEPDGGMYDAVSKGLSRARGEILAYVNTDDFYFPWTVQTVVDVFRSEPSADITYGDYLRMFETDGIVELRFHPNRTARMVLRRRFLMQPTVFWRRHVYSSIGGFDPTLKLAGDFDYWIRAAAKGFKFLGIREILAVDRKHEAQQRVLFEDAHRAEKDMLEHRYASQGYRPRSLMRVVDLPREILSTRLNMLWLLLTASMGRGNAPWREFARYSRERNGLFPAPHRLLTRLLSVRGRGGTRWVLKPEAFDGIAGLGVAGSE